MNSEFNQFVAAINAHDVPALSALMSTDHLFIDSLGNQIRGAAKMQGGWAAYFKMCPDYWIKINQQLAQANEIIATGEAGGTIDGVPWKTPAAWRAILQAGKVLEWQVFADNKPVYDILAKRSAL